MMHPLGVKLWFAAMSCVMGFIVWRALKTDRIYFRGIAIKKSENPEGYNLQLYICIFALGFSALAVLTS